jgi:hypothetical protein
MSNGWSTSVRTLKGRGLAVNGRYSKSAAFEMAFRRVVDETFVGTLRYFSVLRPFSDLWIARRFAEMSQYHSTFLTCQAALDADKSRRLDHWCGRCDKCCMVNLSLAPFLTPVELRRIFGGREPLDNANSQAQLAGRFEALLGLSSMPGLAERATEIGGRRAAIALASKRPDRAGAKFLQVVAARLPTQADLATAALLLQPIGGHFIPDAYAPAELLT